MIERRSGYILNIGSLAGRFGLPFQSSYSASKFALAGFSWSLRNEVKKFGIHIVMLEPGHIRTSITPDVYLAPDSAFKGDMARTLQARDRNMAKGADPTAVAKKALKILKMKNPAPFYAVGGTAPLVVFLKRFMSDRFIEKQIKKNAGL
jgi:short-subunit dehydrogenase